MAKGSYSISSKARSMKFIFLFMFMLNFILSDGDQQEVQLLLSFKASLHDPLHFLSNWVSFTSSATICKWHGITCDNNANSSHVNAAVLSGKNITGEVSSSIFSFPTSQTSTFPITSLLGKSLLPTLTILCLKSVTLTSATTTSRALCLNPCFQCFSQTSKHLISRTTCFRGTYPTKLDCFPA